MVLPGTNANSLARFGPTSGTHSGAMKTPPMGTVGSPMLALSATIVMSEYTHICVAPATQ